MDILPNRNKSTIIEYFNSLKNPENVQVVTMDMWKYYRDAVYQALPNAFVVIDKFHVVKIANDALNTLRKSYKDELGRKRNKALKHDRYLLLKREHDLKPLPDIPLRDTWLNEIPRLKTAYELKEEFFKIYDSKTKKEALRRYKEWKLKVPSNMKEYKEVIKSVEAWKPEIFNYFDFRVTNAFVEGFNSTIRAIEKQGRGYSFDVLRAKVIFCINHKVDKPSYGQDRFYDMPFGGFNMFSPQSYMRKKDYGVKFDDIINTLNEGML